MEITTVQRVGRECGFELVGVASAGLVNDYEKFETWVERGYAGEMRYLTDHRGKMRSDVRKLLPSARSVICVGKLYNTDEPQRLDGDAKISRYAWGRDYHEVLRDGLQRMVGLLQREESFEYKICVDTAPLLERSLAREAGLGWIGRNTCLINEPQGSWFFLGEIVTSLELEAGMPPPDRCGSCRACIDACPTQAIIPYNGPGDRGWTIDSRKCISYLTIELRGPIAEEQQAGIGEHVFGCDICQDVCPWNRRAPVTEEAAFEARPGVALDEILAMEQEEFRARFRTTPLYRTKLEGLRRNAAIAQSNAAKVNRLKDGR
jgi:epoxyqueuosine reductase